MYLVNALMSLVRVVFSSPAGMPETIGVADPMTVLGIIVMLFEDSAMKAPALNACALPGAMSVVKWLPATPSYADIELMMFSMLAPDPPLVLIISMKL